MSQHYKTVAHLLKTIRLWQCCISSWIPKKAFIFRNVDFKSYFNDDVINSALLWSYFCDYFCLMKLPLIILDSLKVDVMVRIVP